MQYKRNTPFRFQFKEPIPSYFRIVRIDDVTVTTSEGLAEIVNISPRGVKLSSELYIPETAIKKIELSLRFHLNEIEFNLNGIIKWKKKKALTTDYGIELLVDVHSEQEIIKQLKIYSNNPMEKRG